MLVAAAAPTNAAESEDEDDANAASAACMLLETLACDLLLVDSPRSAVAAIACLDFDLVLVDGREAPPFGSDTVHAIRLHESRAGVVPVTIAVLVARPPSREDRGYLAIGADEVLAAPVTHTLLAALLARRCQSPRR